MKKDHLIASFLVFVLILVLVACNGQITATPPPQELPTQSFTPKIQPTASSTFTPLPPREATKYAGMLVYASTQTARVQNALADCNGYPNEAPYLDHRYYSSSKNWYAAYCDHSETGRSYTAIINAENTVRWEVPFYETWGIQKKSDTHPNGIMEGQMNVVAWSIDEKYVFLETYYCCLDGPGIEFSAGFGLYQLELGSGKIARIESGSLSPDGYSLIFHDDNNYQVIVKNLKTGQTTPFRINKGFENAGIFQWSPDGSKIVFSAADENWFETDASFTMYLVDINKNTIRKMLYDPLHRYVALKWLSEKEILLEGYRSSDDYVFNIETSKLTPIDPTILTLTPFE